jgi:hypothetical protein
LREAIGKKSNSTISEIKINGENTNDKSKIANEFNNFFSTVGSRIAEEVAPIDRDPISFVQAAPDVPTLEMGGTGSIEVLNILKAMEKKSSPDLDGISLSLLKSIANEISTPLGDIFNLSLETGVFPCKLKTSRVVPIFKAGDKSCCDNYRLISLVSSISKILEKAVASRLVNHLVSNDLLYEHQYGFLKGRSTEQNLLHLVNTVGQAINEDKYCIGIFLDIKKAFDVVSHDILLKKLEKLGITGISKKWFESYLADRKQRVDIQGNLSECRDLKISVLQGTILGPILFLVFINDLPQATYLLSRLFADDTACLASNSHLPTLIDLANTELQKLANWFRANKMVVNISKTKFIIFHGKGKKVNMDNLSVVFNNNEIGKEPDPSLITPLERVHNQHPIKNMRSYKLLGVHLDEYLNFGSHIDVICNKLNNSIYCINRAKNFLSKNALRSLYYALIHPHLLYCINVYSCTNKSNLKRLTILQKKAIRTINLSPAYAHTKPLFTASKILPLDLLIVQNKLLFMHSIQYGYGPPTFMQIWQTNYERNPDLNLRNADDLYLPIARVDSFKNIPLYSFPLEWNNLADEIKYQFNRFTFKTTLKNHLLNKIELL